MEFFSKLIWTRSSRVLWWSSMSKFFANHTLKSERCTHTRIVETRVTAQFPCRKTTAQRRRRVRCASAIQNITWCSIFDFHFGSSNPKVVSCCDPNGRRLSVIVAGAKLFGGDFSLKGLIRETLFGDTFSPETLSQDTRVASD